MDSDFIPAVRPLNCAAEPEGDSVDLEGHLYTRPDRRGKPLPGAHTAPFQAEIDDATLHRQTMAHQKQRGIFVHGIPGARAPLPSLPRQAFRRFFRFHGLLRRILE